uniref:Uncharacterized protein n=1 Tax=Oryza brachyantha TaxID=4533 RepID=J3M0B1_ORYBR
MNKIFIYVFSDLKDNAKKINYDKNTPNLKLKILNRDKLWDWTKVMVHRVFSLSINTSIKLYCDTCLINRQQLKICWEDAKLIDNSSKHVGKMLVS